jgi:hypothetical protein
MGNRNDLVRFPASPSGLLYLVDHFAKILINGVLVGYEWHN